MDLHVALSQGVWLTPTVRKSKHHIKGGHRGCLQVTGRREVKGRSQAGSATSLGGDGEKQSKKKAGWLSGRPKWEFLLLNPHSSTTAEIKPLPFKIK